MPHVRVWLLEGLDNAEPGFQAWALDYLGLATWAPTRDEVLERMPAKYEEYRAWLGVHRFGDLEPGSRIDIAEEIHGDEVLFTPDRRPTTESEINRTVQLLQASRSDLISVLEDLPAAALDWDPPYERFLPWASWRTARQVAVHIANTETHYYLTAIGFDPPWEPVPSDSEWHSFLADRRADAIRFISELRGASDLVRVDNTEAWSVRKVLRRMVWHERLHTKSLRRILDEYARRPS